MPLPGAGILSDVALGTISDASRATAHCHVFGPWVRFAAHSQARRWRSTIREVVRHFKPITRQEIVSQGFGGKTVEMEDARRKIARVRAS